MDNWMPPKLKAILTYGTNTTDITGDVTNWNELMTSMQRDGVSGVFMSVDMPIKVTGETKTILNNLFFTSFLSASASIQILQRDPFDLDTYTQIHAAKLNFSTFKEDANTAEISSEVRDFNNLVKSVGKTKYDIEAMDVIDEYWEYGHNPIFSGGDYEIPEVEITPLILTFDGFQPQVNGVFFTNINLNKASIPLGGMENDFRSQEYGAVISIDGSVPVEDKYFFQAELQKEYSGDDDDPVKTQTVIVDVDFTCRRGDVTENGMNAQYIFYIEAYNDDGVIYQNGEPIQPGTDKPADFDIKVQYPIKVSPGDKIRCYVLFSNGANDYHKISFSVIKFRKFRVLYVDKSKRTDTIPAVTALTMANHLLYLMSGKDWSKAYKATIAADTDNPWPFDHYLVAAESIRGLEKAKFHANFNDFLDYMQFLGYEWDVDESTLTVAFKKRDVFFDPSITAIELTEEEVADLQITADDEYAYSTVRVGYEKPDIEDTNGRFAVCGAFDYATDYKNQGDGRDSSLEIMCPYKADPVEIEALSWARGEKTTDQKADNDIFMLAGEINADGDLVESRQTEYLARDTDTNESIAWFNVPYIPYFITRRNAQKIAVATKYITFTGTDAYRDASLRGSVAYDIYSDVELPNGLFSPLTYEFEAGTHQSLPDPFRRFGLVSFPWKGVQYRGFISKLVKAHNNEAPTGWTLLGYTGEMTKNPIVFYGQVTEYEDLLQKITFTGTITEEI